MPLSAAFDSGLSKAGRRQPCHSRPMPSCPTSRTAAPLLAARAPSLRLPLIGTVLLWAHYGTTVFFETIRAGFSACFG